MKKITLFISLIAISFGMVAQQIAPPLQKGENFSGKIKPASADKSIQATYEEGFSGTGSTTGMTTVNVDGNTDNATYTQGIDFSGGWIMSLTFDGTEFFGCSNSNFDPPGQADRWLFTPEITAMASGDELSWDASAIPLGGSYTETYEVYVTTSIAGTEPAPSDFSTVAGSFSVTTASGLVWTHEALDLTSYAGGSAWIAFRHTSNAQGALAVDNIRVGSSIMDDIKMKKAMVHVGPYGGYYGSLPVSQAQDVMFGANVNNLGANNQTNVTLNVNINNGTFTSSSDPYASLTSGTNDTLYANEMFSVPATADQVYECVFDLTQDQTDESPDNNKDTVSFMTSETFFSRAGAVTAYCGLGSYGEAGCVIGAMYYFMVGEQVDSLFAYVADNSPIGGTVTLKMYEYDMNTGGASEVASTAAYTITLDDNAAGALVTLPLTSSFTPTDGGLYVIGAELGGTDAGDIQLYGDNQNPFPAESVQHYMDPQGTGFNWYYFTADNANVPWVGAILAEPTGIENTMIENTEINVYPNPAKDQISIDNAEYATVQVYNMIGEIVVTESNINNNAKLDLSSLSEGTYLVKVIENNSITTKKITLVK